MGTIEDIMDILNDLLEDSTVPKNVKIKIKETLDVLRDEDTDISIKVDKALNILDEIGDDANLQPYTRTQIWNIVSLLENVH